MVQTDDFINKLLSLDIGNLPISEYNKRYLKKHLEHAKYNVSLALQIIESGTGHLKKPVEEITVLEIGGGTGLISLLCVFLGFKKVIYSDTYQNSCDDFEVISEKLNLSPAKIVCGSVVEAANLAEFKPDLILSRDVVEHIYDLKSFFTDVRTFFPQAVQVHNTSANPYNVFKRKYFREIQIKDELHGNPDQFKPGDSKEAFYQLRLKYIQANFKDLSKAEMKKLALVSRGKTYSDIGSLVKAYLKNQEYPEPPSHPYNTCDPVNGNWTERLLSIDEYHGMAGRERTLFVNFALYNTYTNSGIKKVVLSVLNALIGTFGRHAKWISPAMVLMVKPIK